MKKITIADIAGIIAFAFIGWVLASWLNVIAHNMDASPVYAAWNFFTIFFI